MLERDVIHLFEAADVAVVETEEPLAHRELVSPDPYCLGDAFRPRPWPRDRHVRSFRRPPRWTLARCCHG